MKMIKGNFSLFAIVCFLAAGLIAGFSAGGATARAADAAITFSTSSQNVKAGNSFTVNMAITADEDMLNADAYVSYDSQIIEFVSGGQYASGGGGLLHVYIREISGNKKSVTVPLTFKAVAAGSSDVNLSDQAVIEGSSGSMAVTSNKITIVAGGSQSVVPGVSEQLSGNNNLTKLEVSAGILDPAFKPNKKKYSITVDCNTEVLYFNYKTEDSKAAVSFFGNEALKPGDNTVMVTVTAQNGDAKDYIIKVKKETEAETRERLAKEGNDGGIGFEILTENGAVVIQNKYRYKIVNVDDSEKIPAGYRKTSVLLYGINVTAYTMENDLDNDFLIMYCENEMGDRDFYLFDRQEKSLQRYFGDLIDRVNKSAEDGTGIVSNETAAKYEKNLQQMAIIIALLAAVCVLLILAMISMTLKKIKNKSNDIADEMDF